MGGRGGFHYAGWGNGGMCVGVGGGWGGGGKVYSDIQPNQDPDGGCVDNRVSQEEGEAWEGGCEEGAESGANEVQSFGTSV